MALDVDMRLVFWCVCHCCRIIYCEKLHEYSMRRRQQPAKCGNDEARTVRERGRWITHTNECDFVKVVRSTMLVAAVWFDCFAISIFSLTNWASRIYFTFSSLFSFFSTSTAVAVCVCLDSVSEVLIIRDGEIEMCEFVCVPFLSQNAKLFENLKRYFVAGSVDGTITHAFTIMLSLCWNTFLFGRGRNRRFSRSWQLRRQNGIWLPYFRVFIWLNQRDKNTGWF